jgi:hypothetical protein
MPVKETLLVGAGAFAAGYLVCALLSLFVLATEKKLARRMIPTILLFPLFLLTWMPANLWAIVTKPPKWTKIAHVRSVDAPE